MSPHRSPRRIGARDVLVLRHGQSVWNAAGRWQGRADTPLSDAGRVGAAELGALLRRHVSVGGGPVWTSPLARARETAAIVAGEFGVPVAVNDQLIERHAGAWQGLTTADIDERWPGDRAASRWPADAEPLDDVAARGRSALVRIAAEHPPGTPPVVITHAGLIRAVLRTTGGEDRGIANLGGAWLRVGQDRVVAGEPFPPDDGVPAATSGALNEDDDRL